MKNYESSNNTSDSATETQWDVLEKQEKKVFHDNKELASVFEQKAAKQKETEIQLAAEKVRKAFASKAEEAQEEPATNRPDSVEAIQVMPTFKPINIIKKLLSDIQEKKIDKLVNDTHDGDSAKQRRNGRKAINLVESGKANLSNPSILNNYMKAKLFVSEGITDKDGQKRSKTYLEKIEDMTRLGIEPQKPIRLIAEDIATRMNKSLNTDEHDLYIYQLAINNYIPELSDTDGSLAKISEIIERYDVPEVYSLIQQRVDIQAFGDKAIGYALERTEYDIDEKSATTNERIKQSKQGIVFLRKLGYEPFKNGVDSLFSDDGSTKKQIIAEELSLINGDIVDSMYQYKINTLNHIIHNHEQYRDIPILESLRSSGKDAFVSFWEQYSRKTGRDELGILTKEAKEHSSDSILIEMAREYSGSNDLKKNPMNYILDNPNILSGPERGLIITLNNLITEASNNPKQLENPPYNKNDSPHEDTKEQYVRQSIKEAINSILRFQSNKNDEQISLFDENGITVVAKEMAIFDHYTRLLITEICPNWGESFSANMQKAIKSKDFERIIAEQPELLAELTPRRRKLVELSKKYPDKLSSYQTSDLTQYFDEDGKILPKLAESFFINKSNGNKRDLLCDMPEIYAYLPIEQQRYLKTLHMIGIPKKVANFSSDEILQYFNENGPTEEFWRHEFSQGDFDSIIRYANIIRENSEKTKPSINQSSDTQNLNKIDYTIFGLNDSQIEILNTYNILDDTIKNDFKLLISDDYNKIPIDRIKIAPQILARLASSNSSEITAHRSAIAKQLLQINLDNNDEVLKKLEQIEDVFIHNNLPFVEKAFIVFQILHPPTSLESDFNLHSPNTISPLLKSLPSYNTQAKTISDIAKNPETVIFSDLLKASFKSNNRSMRRYLENLRIGQNLITSLSSGKISWDRFKQPGDNMEAKIEREALTIFAQHLKTLYNNTDSGRKTPFKLTDNLEQDLTSLVSAFSPNERHKLGDRIVRSFTFFAGIKDLDSTEALLDSTTENTTLRNKEAERNGLKLEQGDLIKGIGGLRYLPNILQNGSVAKEFLGDSADSDATPLDTDLSIILKNPDNILSGIEATDAENYGPIWLVLKGDDNRSEKSRFSITRRSPLEQNQQVEVPEISEKLEAFYTGILSASHYGIRTGFGSSEIDYFITDNGSTNGTPNSQAVGLEVALNGFYIPVVDKSSGEVVFSPNDYDALRRKMSGLSYYETGDYQFASDTDLRFGAIEINGAKVDSIDSIISRLTQNEQEVRKKHEAIDDIIDDALGEIGGLTRKNYIDGDLTEGIVELIDTGSTGRFDNTPGSGDFDYMMRVDKSIMDNPAKLAQISNALLSKFDKTEHAAGEVLDNGNLRLKGVFIKGLDTPVDIDISFTQKTNKVQYSTDMALADRLESIRRQSPEKHQQVVANIIFAKQFLKAAESYKPNRGETPQGGLGGVGIENWVLQNGGSFLSAAKEFMSVAEKCENFDEFKAKYAVWDFGENHMAKGERQHDNFVTDNMSADGYERMKKALSVFLAQQS